MLFRTILTSILCVALVPSAVRAGFVLDDFDDPAQTISPEMENDYVTTENVGVLNAHREIRIAASRADPEATFDTDITAPSTMTAHLMEVNQTGTSTSAPLFAFQFNYNFTPTDVSQGGENNAVLFDFAAIDLYESQPFLRVIVRNTTQTHSYEQRVYDLPMSSGPFTVAMPFSSFTIRGGAPGLPDLTTLDEMEFDLFFQPSDDAQFFAQLERIRFGRIPEPGSQTLCALALICVVCWQFIVSRNKKRRRVMSWGAGYF